MELATVIAANDRWIGPAPEGSEVVETNEYRLVRLPDRFPDPLQVQWIRSARPADAVLDDVVARAASYGLSELQVYEKIGSPEGLVPSPAGLVVVADGARHPIRHLQYGAIHRRDHDSERLRLLP
jgi:hypothetical protein